MCLIFQGTSEGEAEEMNENCSKFLMRCKENTGDDTAIEKFALLLN